MSKSEMPLIPVFLPNDPTCKVLAVFDSVSRNSLFSAAVNSPYRKLIVSRLLTAKFVTNWLNISAMDIGASPQASLFGFSNFDRQFALHYDVTSSHLTLFCLIIVLA